MPDYHYIRVSVARSRVVAVDKRVAKTAEQTIARAKRKLIEDVEYYRFDADDVSAELSAEANPDFADDVIGPE